MNTRTDTDKTKVFLLGPADATFSGRAWRNGVRSNLFPLPGETLTEIASVASNEEVLPRMLEHPGSYGIIAAKTKANGRVTDAFDSLVDVGVKSYGSRLPINIIGAMQMRLSFVLMARKDMAIDRLDGILGHKQALGACRKNIGRWKLPTKECDSNGLAAQSVALEDRHQFFGAVGPIEAAHKHRLHLDILSHTFEDAPSFTTFYLLGPEGQRADVNVGTGVENRAVVVFRTHDHPGALHDVLGLFKTSGINLKHLHSVDETDEISDFVCEAHVHGTQLAGLHRATRDMRELGLVKSVSVFGPFPFREMPNVDNAW